MYLCNVDSDSEKAQPEELKESIKRGDLEMVKELLEEGADLQHRYANGLTPLHLAVVHEHLEVVRLLMQRGADPLARTTDENKLSPIDLAHVENQQAILEVLCNEGDAPFQRRFMGPSCLLMLIACNAGAFWAIHFLSGFETNSSCVQAILILVMMCLVGLVLSNSLDPGTVDVAEVEHLQELRDRPDAKVSQDPSEEETFILENSDDEQEEPYRWCRSCRIWRPPGVSHCSECRRCFWRMDHHCWMIGNCVAMRNHRFFTLMVVAGCAAWATSFAHTVWSFLVQETRRSFLEFHFTDLLSVAFLAWSMLGLSFLVPFSLFHVSALLCNVTSKNACGHRRISLQSRRMNHLAEYNQIFCGPLQIRSCEDRVVEPAFMDVS